MCNVITVVVAAMPQELGLMCNEDLRGKTTTPRSKERAKTMKEPGPREKQTIPKAGSIYVSAKGVGREENKTTEAVARYVGAGRKWK